MRRRAFATSSWAALARRFRRDERGNVMIYVSVSIATLMGMIGLALDGGRAMITHSEAQAAADAAALAGASQLDGQTGACANAKTEAAAAVTNQQRFATNGPANVTIASGSPVCLSGLPASDSASTSGYATTDDAASQYIQVTTQQLTHQNTFLSAVASNNTATIQNTAVAGFHRALCAASPVMMACDSLRWSTGVAFDAWDNSNQNLKGFLTNCSNNGNGCVTNALAGTQAAMCVSDSAVLPAPGNRTTQAADAINTRFGVNSTADDPSDLDVVTYPRDNPTQTPTGWNCSSYWTANHSDPGAPAAPAGCTSTATITRYSVYQYERSTTHGIPAAGVPATSYTSGDERRLVYLAVFACPGGVLPEGFLKAFMIEPASGKNNKTQYVEPLGWATSKTDPTAVHEEVQLYR